MDCKQIARGTILVLAMAAGALGHARADVVLEWNELASDVLVADQTLQNPGMASRTMAMMNVAIYDAFAMMSPGGTMFHDYGIGHTSPGYAADKEAAAVQAAYTVLNGLYGDQGAMLQQQRTASLAGIAGGSAKLKGLEIGAMIGQRILLSRASDGYDTNGQYQESTVPGRWQSDPLNPGQQAWGPNWGDVAPFAMQSTTQFLAPPMPGLGTQAYADAYNEVKVLGALDRYYDDPGDPGKLTDDPIALEHLEIGNFWAYDRSGMGTPMRMFNNVLRTIAEQQQNTPEDNAKLFAKATVAMADAGIAAWNSKFAYDLWRPVTGIRRGDEDGNAATDADEDWTPIGAPGGQGANFTPPFPTYISGHATFGGALFQTLINHYGQDDIAFSLTSEELENVTRDFSSFSEAMAENGRSRVYLGIHWNFDDTEGQEVGKQIANYLFATPFVGGAAIPEPGCLAGFAWVAFGVASGRRRRD